MEKLIDIINEENMRWNESEMVQLAWDPNWSWEGKLTYKSSKNSMKSKHLSGIFQGGTSSDEPRERWFRLRANCLFYFRLTQTGSRPALGTSPLGVIILENYHVQPEGFETPNAFSIIFKEESGFDKKHLFIASCERHSKQWQTVLKEASYQGLRDKLINLQITLRQKTNIDPLRGTGFETNPLFSPGAPTPTAEKVVNGNSTLNGFADNFVDMQIGPPPKPKPRKAKSTKASTFQSHVMENWETHSPMGGKSSLIPPETEEKSKSLPKTPSFKSHTQVPTGNLLDL